jgi:uncharacterized protein YjbJ (UPF0337 family)
MFQLDGAAMCRGDGDGNQQSESGAPASRGESRLIDFRLECIRGRYGLLADLDAVLVSEEIRVAKSDPVAFLRVCERLGVEPSQAVSAGDWLVGDAVAAQRAGLTGIWLDRGLDPRTGLPSGANHFRRRHGNTDEVKGRVKEALGDLTDDDKLKKEGSIDRAKGQVKDVVDKAADKAAGKD